MRSNVLTETARAAVLVATLGASAFAPSAPAAVMKQTVAKNMQLAARMETSAGVGPASYDVNGTASWYGADFDGRLDARGEQFDSSAMTAAHRTLPLNSVVMVTNLQNGRQVQVRITDRGPYAHRRLIDLSRAAADALGYTDDGVARVNVRAVAAR